VLSSSSVVVVDYQMGNLRSVEKSFQKMNCSVEITNDHKAIQKAEKIVLPGVGSFRDGMKNLEKLGLADVLRKEVILNKKPFLGICLGMHLIAKKGYENGQTCGLNWLDAEVVRFDFQGDLKKNKIPHVGWNSVRYVNTCDLYSHIPNNGDFYFVHSYHFRTNEDVVTGITTHGIDFVSSIQKDNIYAFQFHPEKSQQLGLEIINNFSKC